MEDNTLHRGKRSRAQESMLREATRGVDWRNNQTQFVRTSERTIENRIHGESIAQK